MKCPKCQYINFDDGEKCRNCGYQFSLSMALADEDLDLPVDRPITGSFDLPLFRDGAEDEPPLVSVPAITRPPLAVRKGALNTPRHPPRRDESYEPHLDLEPEDADGDASLRHRAARHTVPVTRVATEAEATSASVGARILSGMVDLILLLGIDAAVLHLTLKACG